MAEYERRALPLDVIKRQRHYGIAGQQLDARGRELPAEVRFPDHYSPPADALTFTRTDFYNSAGSDNATPALLTITLPQDSVGVIRDFSRYVNDMVATDDITWDIRINGSAVANWSAVKMFPTVAGFRSTGDDPYILIPSGATVDVLITNATATLHKIGASFYGWFWPNRKAGV